MTVDSFIVGLWEEEEEELSSVRFSQHISSLWLLHYAKSHTRFACFDNKAADFGILY